MNVNTGVLKNKLSYFLRHLRKTGESIVVCDRNEPIATLSPIERDSDAEWVRQRQEALARAGKIGLKLDIPVKRPTVPCMPEIKPRIAPDRRADLATIEFERKGQRY